MIWLFTSEKIPIRERLWIMHQTGIRHDVAHFFVAWWRLRRIVGPLCAARLAWIAAWTVPEDYTGI